MPHCFATAHPRVLRWRDAWMFGSPKSNPSGWRIVYGGTKAEGKTYGNRIFRGASGRRDPIVRRRETGGVSAEVLYPGLGLSLYCVEDAALEALFKTYNDWLIDYCKGSRSPLRHRLISVYNIDNAIASGPLQEGGVIRTMIWQVPHEKLPFTSEHYERFGPPRKDLSCRFTPSLRVLAPVCIGKPPTA